MDQPMLRRVEHRGLGGEAADRIREAIFGGVFAPGSALREVDLAGSLDISRGSVREGLGLLEREGLIRTAWHRGTRVLDVTPHDIEEVYTLRAALDRLAATTARGTANDSQLAAIDEAVTAMESALAKDADGRQLVALDMAFHDAVYAAANNSRLTRAWQSLRSQVHLFHLRRVALSQDHYRSRVLAEHGELADLIRSGELEVVARVAEDHVHAARLGLLNQLRPDP